MKKSKKQLLELARILKKSNSPFCNPPNITHCKFEIYPDYDCNKCKWKSK